MENSKTRAWRLYELGREYNSRLSPDQYSLVETNTEFFKGNQWLHLPDTPAMRSLPKPTFNILNRIASLFIASLTSSGVTIRFEPLAYYGLPQTTPAGGNPGVGGLRGTGGAYPPQDTAAGGGGQTAPSGVDAAAGGVIQNFSEPLFTGTPDSVNDGDQRQKEDVSDVANAEVLNLLEKFKFDYRVRDALFAGAQTGDYCAHFWFDPDAIPYGGAFGSRARGEIRMELVDGINVMFGNPNRSSVEDQPYILLIGRDTVENLREEQARFRRVRAGDGNDGAAIVPDSETQDFPGIGGQTELTPDEEDGKALYVLLYTRQERAEKERGPDGSVRRVSTIHVTKATKNAVIYEDVDTGLSVYPIAWGNWERQKNQYHGRALVTSVIPNQIFINTMFATAMRHLQLMSFPKTIYNADLIPVWSGEVGQAIGVHGIEPGQGIPQVAANLQAPEMSGQIFALIDKAMAYTKECLGATDAQMGNVRPDNTSALVVLQTNAEVPLENIRANLHEWVEDIGKILLDMMGTYYGRRPVVTERDFREFVTDEVTGGPMIDGTGRWITRNVPHKVAEDFDFGVLKHLWLNLRVDVGATTVFSELALTRTLDNLRRDGLITARQYLERLPDKMLPRKDDILRDLENALLEQQTESGGMPSQGGGQNAADTSVQASADTAIDRIPQQVQRIKQGHSAARIM